MLGVEGTNKRAVMRISLPLRPTIHLRQLRTVIIRARRMEGTTRLRTGRRVEESGWQGGIAMSDMHHPIRVRGVQRSMGRRRPRALFLAISWILWGFYSILQSLDSPFMII